MIKIYNKLKTVFINWSFLKKYFLKNMNYDDDLVGEEEKGFEDSDKDIDPDMLDDDSLMEADDPLMDDMTSY